MPQHLAIQPGKLYPQPDYSVAVDREGKWTATQVFLCHRNSIVRLMPMPGTPHPEIPFITVDNVTAKVGEGDLAEITCNYAGADPSTTDGPSPSSSTVGLSLSEEPLLSHPSFKDLDDAELEALKGILAGKEKDDTGTNYKDKITSDLGKKALAKIMRGQTSYYSPKIVWRESYTKNRPLRASDLNKIGEIDQPEKAPGLSNQRNWLLNGLTQSQEGSSFRIEKEWLCSDLGGWDPDIYNS